MANAVEEHLPGESGTQEPAEATVC